MEVCLPGCSLYIESESIIWCYLLMVRMHRIQRVKRRSDFSHCMYKNPLAKIWTSHIGNLILFLSGVLSAQGGGTLQPAAPQWFHWVGTWGRYLAVSGSFATEPKGQKRLVLIGMIDPDHQGEIELLLRNQGSEDYAWNQGIFWGFSWQHFIYNS